ncbi:Phosphate transport regulator (distant homolog of PhoU) [Aedoeadaptatus ivorii]|uniref:Phosphate transport regulator (Distant homolog of PhoU) n=1 Tax=Aedoeadaptatus ivorii TaxID=54006 RepID=A0A448V0L1_9FIRM|nr:DUF47 family protein [Peptoniphilus ivorii]MDQ0509008.1 uncharacterized protein Yka (UPF0111/DUF47 family) [Peptoniphilus ivorii]VEJ35070.1 Phosphate transport regulator (distant homolog of PhoU) [Peptoniphilus ivorii]
MRERKFDYFQKFSDMTDRATAAARLLSDILNNYDHTKLKEKTEAMKRIENDADHTMHSIMNQLAIEFLPPIEREDIIEVTQKLDTVVDSIEEILLGLYMYRVRELIPECIEFGELILEGTLLLEELVLEFSNFKRSNDVKDRIIHINSLEGKGDELYLNSMRALFDFTGTFDPRRILTWKELLTVMENCMDSIEGAANEFESAMLKNQ